MPAPKDPKQREEWIRKIRDARLRQPDPRLGKKHSIESRKKMSESGKKRAPPSEETRKKLSEATKGENNPFYGQKHTLEVRRKISEFNKVRFKDKKNHPMYGKRGDLCPTANENHYNWKGKKAGMTSIHDWVKKRKKKPEYCEWYGTEKASPECYGTTDKLDASNTSGEYLRDIDDYEYICKKCHTLKDEEIRRKSYEKRWRNWRKQRKSSP